MNCPASRYVVKSINNKYKALYPFGGSMDSQQLFSRIKRHDKQAFKMLVMTYGKSLYLELYAISGDADVAKQATKAAFTELYMALNSHQSPDVAESLLFSIGEKKQRELLKEQADKLTDECFRRFSESCAKKTAPKAEAPKEKPAQTLKAETAVPVDTAEAVISKGASEAPLAVGAEKTRKKAIGFGQVLIALLIASALWMALGWLMQEGYLPVYDLGYSWFNQNIARLFMGF